MTTVPRYVTYTCPSESLYLIRVYCLLCRFCIRWFSLIFSILLNCFVFAGRGRYRKRQNSLQFKVKRWVDDDVIGTRFRQLECKLLSLGLEVSHVERAVRVRRLATVWVFVFGSDPRAFWCRSPFFLIHYLFENLLDYYVLHLWKSFGLFNDCFFSSFELLSF